MFSSTVEIVKMTLYFQEFPSIIIFCSSLNFLDLLGMDESKRSGRSTRKALSDFTLMPSICRTAKSEENKLEERRCIYVLLFVSTLPDHDNCEVENIPRVAEVRIWMRYKTIRYDFH